MTREEALNKAINIVSYFEAHFAKSKEAREDAANIIEALEQEPCEDYISRQALLKLMGEEPFNWTDSDKELQEVEDYRNFRNIVEQLPSVNPQEQKTGHWTIKQYQVPIENKQVPTVSGITFPTEPTACKIICTFTHSDCESEEYLNKYNYCPNCGCRMIEP